MYSNNNIGNWHGVKGFYFPLKNALKSSAGFCFGNYLKKCNVTDNIKINVTLWKAMQCRKRGFWNKFNEQLNKKNKHVQIRKYFHYSTIFDFLFNTNHCWLSGPGHRMVLFSPFSQYILLHFLFSNILFAAKEFFKPKFQSCWSTFVCAALWWKRVKRQKDIKHIRIRYREQTWHFI